MSDNRFLRRITAQPAAALRVVVVLVSAVGALAAWQLSQDMPLSVAISTAGVVLTIITFLEPTTKGLQRVVDSRSSIGSTEDIYGQVVELIRTADSVVRFRSPTTTWGIYSAGLRIFEQTFDEIERAIRRGVEVRILTDISDWEKAVAARSLGEVGAHLRYLPGVHDYYVIQDSSCVLTMGTDPKRLAGGALRRNLRPILGNATLSHSPADVQMATERFDEAWDDAEAEAHTARIHDLTSVECPRCYDRSTITFDSGRAVLKRVNDPTSEQ